jgi:hypothetical protein
MLRILALPALALLAGALTETGVSRASTGDPVKFRVRVENVSTMTTLKLSNGQTAPAPTAPVLWLVHTTKDPIFRSGQRDEGKGLEHLAEDGNPGALAGAVASMMGVRSAGFVNMPKGAAEAGPILPGNAYDGFPCLLGAKSDVWNGLSPSR